jgi:hypothetical protein
MIRKLKKVIRKLYYFDFSGGQIEGKKQNMIGDCSGIWGDCTGLSGDCSELHGDCSKLIGNCSGIFGDCSGIRGNLDLCDITQDERKKGVHIHDLIQKE